MRSFFKMLLPLAIVAVIGGVSWWGYNVLEKKNVTTVFKTESVCREDVTYSISASGTVEPEELINVGAQVSGKIMSFGVDADGKSVDYGSRVKAGALLAQIDDVLYIAELRESEAQKAQAEASVLSAEASIISAKAAITSAESSIRQVEARLNLAKVNWDRACSLWERNAISKSDYDSAEADYISAQADAASADAELERAKAQLAIAESQLANADAQLAIADAALIRAQRNLDYCAITSPVDGIVIDRRVSVGQTVVSNMSVSSIFLIAKDFKNMEVWVSVNEADIGSIKPGMPAEFTIDTFPGDVFYGKVKRVRLNATMSQNVVTYIVEVVTDNSSGKLLPYLTANVKFIRERRENVLTVSNAALRFQPDVKFIAPQYRDMSIAEGSDIVYVAEGEFLRPTVVKTGLNALGRVELIDPPLQEGDVVVYGITEVVGREADEGDQGKHSPFMPKPENQPIRGSGSAANRERAKQAGN